MMKPTPREARTHATFTALMWALAHPGRVHILPSGGTSAFVAVAEALIDLETTFFTPDAELATLLARTGARAAPVERAAYHFYPRLGQAELALLRAAPVGSYAYPDEGATLVIGCRFVEQGRALRLRGPGIVESICVRFEDLPPGFWALRAGVLRYPLGWDIFFIAGDWVVGLPRTTLVEEG